jgi:hypothetical protein
LKCSCKACPTLFNLNISWRALSFFLFLMFLSLNSQHISHLPNITHPQSIKRNLQPHYITNHHGFTFCKNLHQWPQQTSKWWTIGIPPSTNHDPYKRMTLGQPKFQHHAYPYYNKATTATLDLGHPTVKHRFCQRYILLLKALKARATGRQSMDHTCNKIQMIETMKGIFWSVKMVTCLLQSAPLQTWTIFLTLTKCWLIWRYSFRRRFQWMKTQFCLTFRISRRPYPASSMRRHLSWHTTFHFMNSKIVLH